MRVAALVDQNGHPIEDHRDVNLLIHDLEEIFTTSRTPPGGAFPKTGYRRRQVGGIEVGKVILRDVDLVGEDNGFPHAKVGEWARKQLSNKARKYGSVKMYLSLRARAEADAHR